MLKEGNVIGERYEIISRIGSGGMADVYKAKDHKLNRFVAMKVLKSEFREDKTFISKFKTEAQSAAGLANPNIVNVFDVGEENGVNYIVMELVEGITLKEYIAKKRKLSVREATSIAIQVCMGLQAAHSHNIVHRDVKPQNIIISTDGKVKVTDFGIARAASSNTISSNAMGSVHYSSPEQVRGGYSDAKSDIYSLGITLYEMVTGRVPFDGETTVAIAIKHLQEEMIAPSTYTPELPYSLEQIIYKCTQKSADRRYNNMQEVISDLKQSLLDPQGNFVQLTPLSDHAKTVMISEDDMESIKRGAAVKRPESQATYSSKGEAKKEYEEPEEEVEEYDDDDDGDDGEVSSKLEKAMTIGGFIVGGLIILLLIYFIANAAGLFKTGGSSETTPTPTEATDDTKTQVPNFVGMTPDQAQEVASQYELGLKKESEESSDEFPNGTIIRQDVEPNSTVDKNTTIKYVVSTGSDKITIPSVVGMTLSEAQAALSNAGITNVQQEKQNSSDVEVGSIISVSPEEGQAVSSSDTVTLVVSIGSGNETVTVPSVTGLSEADGRSIMESLGLIVTTTTGHSNEVAIGEVMKQSISRDQEVTVGTEITLTINSDQPAAEPTATPAGSTATPTPQATSAPAATGGSWSCDEQLGAPDGYRGGNVRLVLEQTVNGAPQETTITEGSPINTWPYVLKVNGAAGVNTGKVYLYEEQNGNYVRLAYWDVPFTQQ